MAVLYAHPDRWIKYDASLIISELTEAKALILSLTTIPFQKSWAKALQALELKREVAGTSKIEGADFTDKEFEDAISGEAPEHQLTRSQRQARAAIFTYTWIEKLGDRPIDTGIMLEIHRRIVTGCDDDHCAPGQVRGAGQNVVFGRPRHRGVEGGSECEKALERLIDALNHEFRAHDPLIQALAFHYHIGAMHPFQDGNGRTARAAEALVLQRAQLKDSLFIAMSNFYYDEKDTYLACLSAVRENDFDLTPFLKFGLRGLAVQCQRLLKEIKTHVTRSLFRDVMNQMYKRLQSTRKRALANRQVAILERLLEKDGPVDLEDFFNAIFRHYSKLQNPYAAYIRDLNHLIKLRAIEARKVDKSKFNLTIRLEWPTEITETDFFREMNKLPEAKTRLLISPSY